MTWWMPDGLLVYCSVASGSGENVICAAFSVHDSSPNGVPRCTLWRTASSSASLAAAVERALDLPGSGPEIVLGGADRTRLILEQKVAPGLRSAGAHC